MVDMWLFLAHFNAMNVIPIKQTSSVLKHGASWTRNFAYCQLIPVSSRGIGVYESDFGMMLLTKDTTGPSSFVEIAGRAFQSVYNTDAKTWEMLKEVSSKLIITPSFVFSICIFES